MYGDLCEIGNSFRAKLGISAIDWADLTSCSAKIAENM